MHHDSVVSHLRAIALLACVASGLAAAESVTVNWGIVTGAVDPRAFGVNGPCLFDPGFATNPNYLTGLNVDFRTFPPH